AVVLIRTANTLLSSRGSGFVVGDGSWVVTASHVVSVDLGKGRRGYDRTALVYDPWTGRPYEARVAAFDPVADIAVLHLPQAGFPGGSITNLCVLNACPDVKPGWSGGPIVGQDRGAVVAVFHSLYRPKPEDAGLPAGSIAGYLGDLLKRTGAVDPASLAHPSP